MKRDTEPVAGETPAIILVDPKFPHNVAGVLRMCSCFGVRQLWWTGDRFPFDPEAGERLPREERMKGYADVTLCRYEMPLNWFLSGTPVAVELVKGAEPLTSFEHPEKAIYVFGPEDGSVPPGFRRLCHRFVFIPSDHCLNLAASVAVVLSHRRMTRQLAGLEPVLPVKSQLKEHRGPVAQTPTLDGMGWEGK